MRYRAIVIIAGLTLAGGAAVAAYQEHQHPAGGAHHHPEAAKVTNPVKADPASIAAGKQVFEKNCASCHGKTGKGDGMMGEELTPKPADLTRGEWKHGSTDGEIFAVIKDGVKGTGMKSFNSKLTAHQIWDVVNYVRTLGAAPSH
jgi:cbb3-type cytochrome c oxidase subunit III